MSNTKNRIYCSNMFLPDPMESIKIEQKLKYKTESAQNHLQQSVPEFSIQAFHTLPEQQKLQFQNPHQNNFYQLILYINGNGKHRVDFNSIDYSPSTLIPVVKNQVQAVQSSPDTEAFILSFTDQFFCRYEEDIENLQNMRIFDYMIPARKIDLKRKDFLELQMLVYQMQAELNNRQTVMQKEIIRDLLRIFINHGERLIQANNQFENCNQNGNIDYTLFCNFRKILNNNYSSNHSVKEYADKLFITSRKLNQLTLRFAGKNAKEMINERLIIELKRLLLYDNKTVKDIAMATGFTDMSNFNKFFKQHTKTTPAKFRSL